MQKETKIGTKNILFRYFWAAILKHYCYFRNQHWRIFQNEKFHPKRKKLWNWDQKCLIWVFLKWNLKKSIHLTPLISKFLIFKASWKKTEKLPIWDKKCINWIFLGMDLKTTAIFEISILAFLKIVIFVQNRNPYIWDHKCLIWVFLD